MTPTPQAQPHLVSRTLVERALYPPHPPRVETKEYLAVHHQLVIVEDQPCRACGVRHSTLHDPASNPFGAKAMETHHFYIELAFTNAIDLAKFNKTVRVHMHGRYPDDPKYAQDFTQEEMVAWIDHDRHQLLCLCDVHHRSVVYGIHAVTFSIWNVMGLKKPEYDVVVAAAPLVVVPADPGSHPIAAPVAEAVP